MSTSDPVQVRTAVDAAVEGYRSALREGDRAYAHDSLERAVLRAIVTRSMAETAHVIRSQFPHGEQYVKELDLIAGELAARDTVGRGLRQIQQLAFARAKEAVPATLGLIAKPLWLVAALGLILGVIGFLVQVGNEVGGAIVLALFAVAALASVAPPVRTQILVLLGKTPHVAEQVGSGLFSSLRGVGEFPGRVGSGATALFLSYAGGPVDALFGPRVAAGHARLVTSSLRTTAGLAVLATFAVLVGSLVFLALGINHGFFEQAQKCDQYAAQTYCGLKR
jgi:hypothetical protein